MTPVRIELGMDSRETEVKFYTADLAGVETRLITLGGQQLEPRTYEVNLRFDTPGREFQRAGRVLRLRRANGIHLTYKDGGEVKGGVISRREIEFSVDNFESAKKFIEALGYEVIFTYEKYRTTYRFRAKTPEVGVSTERLEASIMLDELPYGSFVEIEGDSGALKPIAQELRLRWERAIPASYHTLFDRLSKTRGWAFRDLTFENLNTIRVLPRDLGILTADD